MKVWLYIDKLPLTAMNMFIPLLAHRGWKTIATTLCDRIIEASADGDGYRVKGEVKNKDVLKARLFSLTLEEQQRLSCVTYPRPHRHESTLYYDWWHYDGRKLCVEENKTCYLDEIFIPIPYQARVWLNDGRHPDHDEYRYSAFCTIEDTQEYHGSAGDDNELDITSEEYVAAMHHLWDQ